MRTGSEPQDAIMSAYFDQPVVGIWEDEKKKAIRDFARSVIFHFLK